MTDILIVGSGAMALLFGSRLAASGQKVTLLGTWKEGIDAVNQSGIRVVINGSQKEYPAVGFLDPVRINPVKQALVLVKSWQTERAAKQLSQILDPDGFALTLQNGLGNAELLAAELGRKRVLQGVTTYGATLLGPGIVSPGGEGLISLEDHRGSEQWIQSLSSGGFSVQCVPDLSGLVWSKLIINVAINPLTAILNVKNGHLLKSRSTKELMRLAAIETSEVARAKGIRLGYENPAEAAESVAEATSNNLSSMVQDMRRGGPTEINAICGEVVREGRSVGLPTPVNLILMLLTQAREELKRTLLDEKSDHNS